MPEVDMRIKKLLSQLFSIPLVSINDRTSSDNVANWSSLGHMTLVLALEEEFNISFTDDQMFEILTYSSIVHAVKEKLQMIAIEG